MGQTSNMQSQINSRINQIRGKNISEALERLENRDRDHFRHEVYKKTQMKKRKGQYKYSITNVFEWFVYLTNDLY